MVPVALATFSIIVIGCSADDLTSETDRIEQTTLGGAEAQAAPGVPLAARHLPPEPERRFQFLPSQRTGIEFTNHSRDSAEGLQFIGSGVAIGDYDNDGLPDVFLTRQGDAGRLYRNLGDFRFEDVTARVKIDTEGMWSTGATFVDVNGDGRLDLYISGYMHSNRLYINTGDAFDEQAARYRLDYNGATVSASFADYDRDGDLDVYLLTHKTPEDDMPRGSPVLRRPGLRAEIKPGFRKFRYLEQQPNGKWIPVPAGQSDRLLRNDGAEFTDVTGQSGIERLPYIGLSANWWDYNDDGWPDLYVANDFMGPDHLYLNSGPDSAGKPTFTDVIAESIPHTPWFSMGSDYGDINNDGLMDYLATDMAGTSHYRDKLSMGSMSGPESRAWFLNWPTPPQYMRNALYVNTGTSRFMESAFLSGLARTDWTWTIRLADFDNDGRLDAYFTNGMSRDWFNGDILEKERANQAKHRSDPTRYGPNPWITFWSRQDPYPLENLSYRNLGNLEFEDTSHAWGLDHFGISTGAATGDLDGDGDLDLVVNGFDEPVRVYRNDLAEGHAVVFELEGRAHNRQALGARLEMELNGEVGLQTRYVGAGRGFMSSSDTLVHFGTGTHTTIDRLTVRWPSGVEESFVDLAANRKYTLTEPSSGSVSSKPREARSTWFQRAETALANLSLQEQPYDDFERQPLLPNKYSQLGPAVAWGDIDADGDLDAYVGRPKGAPKEILINEGGNRFRFATPDVFDDALLYEDMGALWLDVDGDGDLDLYVVSGGVEAEPGDASFQDRLYLNEGKNQFSDGTEQWLPQLTNSGGVAAAADFDRNGTVDIFIGGRIVPGQFPTAPQSVLLVNDGSQFSVADSEVVGNLQSAGMVTGAVWTDTNDDGWPDLVATYEWGPVRLFQNNQGRFEDITSRIGLDERTGWFNSVAAGDVDNDGDTDYFVGNFGLNTKYHPEPDKPELLFYGDFDGSGNKNIVEAKFEDDVSLPHRGLGCASDAMPFLKEKLPTYHEFAISSLEEIFTPQSMGMADRYQVDDLRSGILLNQLVETGAVGFEFIPLPPMAQISPIYGCQFADVNGDGQLDLYVVQNFFGPQRETGYMDGGVSLLLTGMGDGTFQPIMAGESGLVVPGDAKGLAMVDLNVDNRPDFVVGVNNEGLQVFQNALSHDAVSLTVDGGQAYPSTFGTRLLIHFTDGTQMRHECYGGSGYLSQSTNDLFLPATRATAISRIEVRWPDGAETSISNPRIEDGRISIQP